MAVAGCRKTGGCSLNLLRTALNWFSKRPERQSEAVLPTPPGVRRGATDHVIILDGTGSTLDDGSQTNAGLIYQLLSEGGPTAQRTLYYEPGGQWTDMRQLLAVAQGKGINRQIMRAYGYLASHYRPGDRIILMGYSRGAFAVRSLAGVIDRVGLLKRDAATQRNVNLAYRHYRRDPERASARAFARRYCHEDTPIEMVGVFDTVKALGLRLPLLWMLTEKHHAFHNHQLGQSIRHGYHALALNETRVVFNPVLWSCPDNWDDWKGKVEQVWFRGGHGDVGGQVGKRGESRLLSNIPLVWMLERLEECGVDLAPDWHERYPCDPAAPMVGTWSGLSALFLLRRRRLVGRDRSERLHATSSEYPPSWMRRSLKVPSP